MNPLQVAVEKGKIDASLSEKIENSSTESGASYEDSLREAGVSADDVREIFAEYFQIPSFAFPDGFSVGQEVLNYIPEDSARHYKMVPLLVEDDVLVVGCSNADDLQMREALNFISSKHRLPYRLVFMLRPEIERVHNFYENLEGDVGDALETLETELDAEIAASLEESGDDPKSQMDHIEEDAPVTKIVATILRYAVDGSASDIHIEPSRGKVGVRFRVDGELATSLELPKNVHMAVVARVKILSAMRLDERRKPQDGRFSATFDNRKIDFRVSILPTNHGEKVVMRILDNEKGVRTLADTGITEYNLNKIKKAVKEPYGIILISGPTGSGKSTTLYGMLGEVDKMSKNVLSLEDPVEYNIDGVSQSQVRPEIGYTFARGLRSALRQDPDIIMVGEIRDKETAQLAIQAALTGHLVLSTIHTNNSIGVIPRLIDMGVDPYLIAPTLKLAIAQRLAKTMCEGTGREEEVDDSTKTMIKETFSTLPDRFRSVIPEAKTIMHPEPSPQCSTGLKGRIAITEVLEVTEEIEGLILKNASEEEFFNAARKNGFVSMQEDAMIKGLSHQIPYEEMHSFGTKIGMETILEDEVPVDNQTPKVATEDIIESNEDTSS